MADFFNKLRDDVREKVEENPALYDAKVSLIHTKYVARGLPVGQVASFANLSAGGKLESLATSYG